MPTSRPGLSPTTVVTAAPKKRAARTPAVKKSPGKPKPSQAKAATTRQRPAGAKTKTTRASAPSASESRGSPGRGGETCAAPIGLGDPPASEALPLIDRVERSIEREISRIEEIVGGRRVDAKQNSDAERRARTLASLTRTLFELRRLRATDEKRPLDDDTVPRDLDELRSALSRRLDQMVAGSEDIPAAGDE